MHSNDSTINSTFKLSLGTIQLLGTVYCPDGTLDWSGFKLLGSNHVRPRSTGIAAAPDDSQMILVAQTREGAGWGGREPTRMCL